MATLANDPTDKRGGHLYVVDKLRHLTDAKAGDRSWWCVGYSIKIGEHSAIYLKGQGVKLLFRTVGPAVACDNFCQRYGMATAPIMIIALFDPPLTVKSLRAHPVLNSLPALGRNFQGTSFRLSLNLFEELHHLSARTDGT